MKTKTFLIPRVVQVPTGVKQIALQKWNALLKTLDFLFLAARFFCLPFWDPFLGGRTAVLKNIGLRSALFVFLGLFSLEVVGRVLEVSSLLALLGLPWVLVVCENTLLATLFFSGGRQFAGVGDDVEASSHASHVLCDVGSSGNQQLADVAGSAGFQQSSPRAVAVERGHFDGRSGRQGVEQPAPGTRWGFRPLTGALSQARKLHRHAIESLNTSLVPHSRLFSLHPSLVSQNSSLSHSLGAMNSCGFMHGLCMHDNSLVMHDNSWGALEHKNSCSAHAAGVRGGTKAPSTSTRIRGRRSAVEKLASL